MVVGNRLFRRHGEGTRTQMRRDRLGVGESITTSSEVVFSGALRLRVSSWRAHSSEVKMLRLAAVRNSGGDVLSPLWPWPEDRADEKASAPQNVSRLTSLGSPKPTVVEHPPVAARLSIDDGGAATAARGS